MITRGKYFAIVSVYHAEVLLCSKQVYINDVGTKVSMDRSCKQKGLASNAVLMDM